MDKVIVIGDAKKKVIINTALITHIFITPDGKVMLIMAGGNHIDIDEGDKFLSELYKLYPSLLAIV